MVVVMVMEHPNTTTKPSRSFFHYLHHLQRSLLSILFSLPTSFFTLLLLFLLAYNAFTVFFWIHLPFFPISPHTPLLLLSPPTHTNWSSSHSMSKLSASVFLAVKQETSPLKLIINKTHFPLVQNSHFPLLPTEKFSIPTRSRRLKRHKRGLRSVRSETVQFPLFQARLKAFFASNSSSSSCKVRFFMTWISPLKAFGVRELFSVESLFKSHPEACLVIVSKSLDSDAGTQILTPFLNNGFRVMAIAPDFNYIFKDTLAESWFHRLKQGNVNPGDVSLGQNLSNLLRLALLYKFGGTYIDADVVVLKSFSKLSNTIGAQNFDVKTGKWSRLNNAVLIFDIKTGKWSRLNNAVLIFDKKHPLLFKFIEEFALTFDGNKWGHNGPYLISRVVSRVSGRPGFNFTVLPPSAFYPVDWRGIRSLFRRPRDEVHSRWLVKKMEQIRKESFAVHLWNRHSKKLKVVKGSIVDSIISSCCIFCNT